jgi:hypothetical protein
VKIREFRRLKTSANQRAIVTKRIKPQIRKILIIESPLILSSLKITSAQEKIVIGDDLLKGVPPVDIRHTCIPPENNWFPKRRRATMILSHWCTTTLSYLRLLISFPQRGAISLLRMFVSSIKQHCRFPCIPRRSPKFSLNAPHSILHSFRRICERSKYLSSISRD